MSSPKLALRVKSKKSQQAVLRDVDPQQPMDEFLKKLQTLTDISWQKMTIMKGFPPKKVEYTMHDVVACLGLVNQDTIIVDVDMSATNGSDNSETNNETNNTSSSQISDFPIGHFDANTDKAPATSGPDGILMRKVVPSDNSCLFNSVIFCIHDGQLSQFGEDSSTQLRSIIATTVSSNPVQYNDAILGRSNADYVKWISNKNSWGGGIELSILSDYYRIEIVVVDIQSLSVSRFGEDKNYDDAIMLLYDGIHYDPLYLEPFNGGAVQTKFPTENGWVLDLAKELGREAKASRQYTDIKNFALRCNHCNMLLKGEAEAQAHAKETSHTDFQETS